MAKQDSGSTKLRRAADQVTVGCTPVGVVIGAMALLVAGMGIWVLLVGRAEALRVLSWFFDLVRRYGLIAIVVAAAVVALVVLVVVPRFRRRVLRLLKWLGGTARRFYSWLLWDVLARPVRDELDVKVSLEREEKKAALDADLRSALPDLGDDGVQVLEVLLGNYQGASERVSVIRPDMDRLDPWNPRSGAAERRVRFACDELKMEGFLAKFASFSDEFGSRTVVVLGRGLPDGLVQRMLGWVRDELISRGKPLREDRHPPVPRPPKGPPPKRVRM